MLAAGVVVAIAAIGIFAGATDAVGVTMCVALFIPGWYAGRILLQEWRATRRQQREFEEEQALHEELTRTDNNPLAGRLTHTLSAPIIE